MSEEEKKVNSKENDAQDAVETDEGKKKHDSEEAGTSKHEQKDTKNGMDFKMDKPWPPLAAEFTGKPRSYSDTSPRRNILKALTKGDIRSCTSYMHLPHIKYLARLHDSSSSPHLHQSFSRMHLPTLDPDNDVPTVSVIALAEARDKDGGDDVIQDDNDVKGAYFPLDDVEETDGVREEAIYTWDREYGRTRSLSDPSDLSSMLGDKEDISQRPRALSLESAEKALRPPARMQFQLKLEELEEELSNGAEESESPDEEPALEHDNLAKSSILVLAESGDFETDSSLTDSHVKDSDSQDEVLTRWTRYDSHSVRKPSFCAELSTIDETNLVEGTSAGPAPIETTGARSRNASVLQLVDEVTKNVMSNENLAVQTGSYLGPEAEVEVDDETFSMNKTSPRFGMRRVTLATTSPLREAHGYATEIEREAFNKISQWKTDFAVKLEDVLSKGIIRKSDEKQQKPVVVKVSKNLTDSELLSLKGNLLSELRRKSTADDGGKTAVLDDVSPAAYCSRSPDAREPLAQESSASSDTAQDDTRSVNLDKIAITKDKITELLQWHDQERERLLLEMKKMQVPHVYSEEPSTAAQIMLDSAGLESVFCSLQVIMDSIFKETILRLRGSLDSDLTEDTTSDKNEIEKGRGVSPTKDKKEKHPKVKKAGKRSADSLASQTDDVEERARYSKQKTRERKTEKHSQTTSKNKQKHVKISSRAQEKPRSTEAAHRKGAGTKSSPVHVHTTSFGEHVCHKDICAGVEEESSPSCECDFASDEMETTESEDEYDETTTTDLAEYYESSELLFNVAGRPEVIPGKSSTNETDVTPTSSTSIPQFKSSTLTSPESSFSDKGGKDSLSSDEFDEEEHDDELDLEESDAGSEIADLLGVYRAYNAVNDHDNDVPPRPHAPELMTYEEKDMRDKMYRQKTRLNGYKRIVRSFKARNKRLKEEQLHLRRQIHELHDRCAKKEARITELKHEIEPAMEGYKKALQDKTNITDTMKDAVEPSWESYDGESKKYLKIIRHKEKVIQELVSQHEKTFQELTNKIYNVMSERDELKEENARLKTTSRADEFQRKRKKLEKQVVRLEKALRKAHLKYEDKDRVNQSIISSLQKKLHETKQKHEEDSRLLRETQRSFDELKTSSSSTMEEQENEILALKASVDAFQNTLRRVTEERSEMSQGKNRTTQPDHDFMKAALKEALEARDDEARRHQQTHAKLKQANERSKDWAATENMMGKMKEQLEALQNENLKLKSHVQDKEESGPMMVQVNELQTKLAKRDCEVKQLKEERMKQQDEINRLREHLAEHSRERTLVVPHDEGRGGGGLSFAERCARQWREETEIEQQELDELRGKTTTSPVLTDKKEVLRLRKDIQDIKSAFQDFLRMQSRNRNIEQDELKKKLELKARQDMEQMESFYKQILETKEKAHEDVLKEKDNMIQIVNESKNLSQSDMVSEALETTMKNVMDRDVSRKIDNLRRSLELMISKLPPKSDVIHEVISDLLKMNQKAINRLEDCTERAWMNVKEDMDELKDFNFKMTDAIEKHFYSAHEELLNSSIEQVIKYVKNEGNGVRKSFVDGMQAHHEELIEEMQNQGKAGMVRYDQLQATLEAQNRSNMREFHQARRDVLLAAETVSNSTDELYQIKRTLTQDMSLKDQNDDEVPEPFGRTLEQPGEDYLSKECSSSKEVQHKGLSVTGKTTYGREGTSLTASAELATLEGAMLRDSLAGMAGEGDSRHTYPLFQTPPSRDSDGLSLRERLQQRKKARTAWTSADGGSPDSYTAKMAPFWSRDKPSSAK